MTIETNKINSSDIYNLMIGSILPRPIAWLCTTNKSGVNNLAAFSFFSVASVNPPVVSFSILNKSDGEQKASLINILQTKNFSINVVDESLANCMAKTSKRYDRVIDKFELCNITKEKCKYIDSFYVKESKTSYECKLREVINFGDGNKAGNLVLADVIAINVEDDILEYPNIDIEKLNPIGRLSSSFYTNIQGKFEIKKEV